MKVVKSMQSFEITCIMCLLGLKNRVQRCELHDINVNFFCYSVLNVPYLIRDTEYFLLCFLYYVVRRFSVIRPGKRLIYFQCGLLAWSVGTLRECSA